MSLCRCVDDVTLTRWATVLLALVICFVVHLKVPTTTAAKPLPGHDCFSGKGHVLNPTNHHKPATVTRLPLEVPACGPRPPPAPSATTTRLLPIATATCADLADVPSLSESDPSQDSQQSTASSTSSIIPKFTLHPGKCDIVLCVDNTEVYGRWVIWLLAVTIFWRSWQNCCENLACEFAKSKQFANSGLHLLLSEELGKRPS